MPSFGRARPWRPARAPRARPGAGSASSRAAPGRSARPRTSAPCSPQTAERTLASPEKGRERGGAEKSPRGDREKGSNAATGGCRREWHKHRNMLRARDTERRACEWAFPLFQRPLRSCIYIMFHLSPSTGHVQRPLTISVRVRAVEKKGSPSSTFANRTSPNLPRPPAPLPLTKAYVPPQTQSPRQSHFLKPD